MKYDLIRFVYTTINVGINVDLIIKEINEIIHSVNIINNHDQNVMKSIFLILLVWRG